MKASYWFIAVFALFSGCASIEPLVQDFNIVSVPDEIKIGEAMTQQVSKEMPIESDPSLNAEVNRVGQRLLAGLARRDFQYRFYVVKDDTPNAFTIPGGSVYIHTGLLKFVSGDSELAGVMGHEIGHAYLRHPAKSISRAYGLEYLTSFLFKGQTTAQSSGALMNLLKGGVLTRYGREDENQADDMGYYLAKRAGYSSDGLLNFLRKLQQLQKGGSTLPFLSSHPPTTERIARLEARIHNDSLTTTSAAY